jgi:hypothetical protein
MGEVTLAIDTSEASPDIGFRMETSCMLASALTALAFLPTLLPSAAVLFPFFEF